MISSHSSSSVNAFVHVVHSNRKLERIHNEYRSKVSTKVHVYKIGIVLLNLCFCKLCEHNSAVEDFL